MSERATIPTAEILFVCGSLEVGRDGVGDYTRRLAGALIDSGVGAGILATHDKGVHAYDERPQAAGDTVVPCYRIPKATSETQRRRYSSAVVSEVDPEWLSVQFVPYSFHDKGLSYRFGNLLAGLRVGRRLHIHFHEIWIGSVVRESGIRRVYSTLQHTIITRMMGSLSPQRCTTTNEAYASSLGLATADIVPLISNIPVAPSPLTEVKAPDTLHVLQFGSFGYTEESVGEQLSWVREAARGDRKDVLLDIVGPHRPSDRFVTLAQTILGRERCRLRGLLPVEAVSALMAISDVGLGREGGRMISKSGSALAMLEHGIPVLLSTDREEVDIAVAPYRHLLFDVGAGAVPPKAAPQPDRALWLARRYRRLLSIAPPVSNAST